MAEIIHFWPLLSICSVHWLAQQRSRVSYQRAIFRHSNTKEYLKAMTIIPHAWWKYLQLISMEIMFSHTLIDSFMYKSGSCVRRFRSPQGKSNTFVNSYSPINTPTHPLNDSDGDQHSPWLDLIFDVRINLANISYFRDFHTFLPWYLILLLQNVQPLGYTNTPTLPLNNSTHFPLTEVIFLFL